MEIGAPTIGLFVELIIGLFSNVFIVSVLFCDFTRQKHMSSSNKILACLGISNVSYGVVMTAGLLDELVSVRASTSLALSSLYFIVLFNSISSCAWLTAGLGIFYFIKVSPAKVLPWVKFRIDSIVPWMLLVLEVVSFIHSLCSSLELLYPKSSFRNITGSPPSVLKILEETRVGLMNTLLAVTTIPFVIVLFSTMCTVWTLKQHSQKMEGRTGKADNGRLTSYERVVERITHLLLFYGLFYALMLVFYFSVVSLVESEFWVTLLLMSSFCPVQSLLIILGNPRLHGIWKGKVQFQAFLSLFGGGNK